MRLLHAESARPKVAWLPLEVDTHGCGKIKQSNPSGITLTHMTH